MDDLWRAVFFVFLLLAALGGWLGSALRRNLGRSLRLALAWAMIFLGVVALYGLRDEISQARLPAQSQTATTLNAEFTSYGLDLALAAVIDEMEKAGLDTSIMAPNAEAVIGEAAISAMASGRTVLRNACLASMTPRYDSVGERLFDDPVRALNHAAWR